MAPHPKLFIGGVEDADLRNYSLVLDAERRPKFRTCSSSTELRAWLLIAGDRLMVPGKGERLVYVNRRCWRFEGHIVLAPDFEYLGWNEAGPLYRYALVARGILRRSLQPQREDLGDRMLELR